MFHVLDPPCIHGIYNVYTTCVQYVHNIVYTLYKPNMLYTIA